jgi:hypothetical protein
MSHSILAFMHSGQLELSVGIDHVSGLQDAERSMGWTNTPTSNSNDNLVFTDKKSTHDARMPLGSKSIKSPLTHASKLI